MSDTPELAPVSVKQQEALTVFDQELDLALLDDESVVFAGRPQANPLRVYLTLAWTLLAVLTVVGIPLLPLVWWATGAYVDKHRYWLTSRRVVVTTGLIGYRARSVPLERISDVAISCSWLERILGLRSIVIRDMTGEAQSGAAMMAVADAPALQRQILERVHATNRTVPGQDSRPMLTAPYREDNAPASQELLDLLRRIEENTRDRE